LRLGRAAEASVDAELADRQRVVFAVHYELAPAARCGRGRARRSARK
jgi:hypothetical protein